MNIKILLLKNLLNLSLLNVILILLLTSIKYILPSLYHN